MTVLTGEIRGSLLSTKKTVGFTYTTNPRHTDGYVTVMPGTQPPTPQYNYIFAEGDKTICSSPEVSFENVGVMTVCWQNDTASTQFVNWESYMNGTSLGSGSRYLPSSKYQTHNFQFPNAVVGSTCSVALWNSDVSTRYDSFFSLPGQLNLGAHEQIWFNPTLSITTPSFDFALIGGTNPYRSFSTNDVLIEYHTGYCFDAVALNVSSASYNTVYNIDCAAKPSASTFGSVDVTPIGYGSSFLEDSLVWSGEGQTGATFPAVLTFFVPNEITYRLVNKKMVMDSNRVANQTVGLTPIYTNQG